MSSARTLPQSLELSAGRPPGSPRYSVCTMVTDHRQHEAMLASFVAAGFTEGLAEYLHVDNAGGNRLDAYSAIRQFIARARGTYLVLCHQDVLLTHDRLDQLERCIAELDALDPAWALLGNAGGCEGFTTAIRITDPKGESTAAPLPRRAQALDENFIVMRADCTPGVSRDMQGFHLYGLDLCLQARLRGYSAYVVDFHLTHLSAGTLDRSFTTARARLIERYRSALAPAYYQTPCTTLYIGGNRLLARLMNTRAVIRWARSLRKRLRVPIGGAGRR